MAGQLDVTALRLSPSESTPPQGCDDALWQYDRAVGPGMHEVIEWANAAVARDDSAGPAIAEIGHFYLELATWARLDMNHVTDYNA